MSVPGQSAGVSPRFQEMMQLHKCWIWFLALGGVLAALGAVALVLALLTTLISVVLLGSLLLAGGVVQIVNAVLARTWKACFMHLLAGVLHLILGGLMV